jgi:iron complex transport system substrate-binding protein
MGHLQQLTISRIFKTSRYWRQGLIAMVFTSSLTACNPNLSEPTLSSSPYSLPPSASQTVEHALGEVKIPTHPQRIIVLHDTFLLDPVLALGIKPTGITTFAADVGSPVRGIEAEQIANVEIVGDGHQPNLEKILALKPDLILARESQSEIYSQLSGIAPTVAVPETLISFKERLRFIAQIFDKEAVAEQVIDQYWHRVEQFKTAMGQRLDVTEVSVLVFAWGMMATPSSELTCSKVLVDIGIRRPPIQQRLANSSSDSPPLSLEVISEHDADVILLITDRQANTSNYLNSPIWSTLQAVQNNQVYQVDINRWHGNGPLAANLILDDLFKYLVNNPDLKGS